MLTPGFHFQILERFILIFEEHIDILINKLQAIPENQVVNIAPMFHALSLDIISGMNYILNGFENIYTIF